MDSGDAPPDDDVGTPMSGDGAAVASESASYAVGSVDSTEGEPSKIRDAGVGSGGRNLGRSLRERWPALNQPAADKGAEHEATSRRLSEQPTPRSLVTPRSRGMAADAAASIKQPPPPLPLPPGMTLKEAMSQARLKPTRRRQEARFEGPLPAFAAAAGGQTLKPAPMIQRTGKIPVYGKPSASRAGSDTVESPTGSTLAPASGLAEPVVVDEAVASTSSDVPAADTPDVQTDHLTSPVASGSLQTVSEDVDGPIGTPERRRPNSDSVDAGSPPTPPSGAGIPSLPDGEKAQLSTPPVAPALPAETIKAVGVTKYCGLEDMAEPPLDQPPSMEEAEVRDPGAAVASSPPPPSDIAPPPQPDPASTAAAEISPRAGATDVETADADHPDRAGSDVVSPEDVVAELMELAEQPPPAEGVGSAEEPAAATTAPPPPVSDDISPDSVLVSEERDGPLSLDCATTPPVREALPSGDDGTSACAEQDDPAIASRHAEEEASLQAETLPLREDDLVQVSEEATATAEVGDVSADHPGSSSLLAVGGGDVDDGGSTTYLWQRRSDKEIVCDIERTLTDFDALTHECDDLFNSCCSGAATAHPEEEKEILVKELHIVTQRLIDRLGSRSPAVLERIGSILRAASGSHGSRARGIGQVEFRGYVAAVLTQILRELEDRRACADDNADSGNEASPTSGATATESNAAVEGAQS